MTLLDDARACTVCASHLPLGPRPLVAGSARSRILLIGQAPGKAAHEAGIPWKDRSGDRLRSWLEIDEATFYDPDRVAFMPMGFCYPGTGASGDLAPRSECAPLWHDRLLAGFSSVRLRIYIGQYPLPRYFPAKFTNLTEAVQAFPRLLPQSIVLPHPSPRNAIWISKNLWFSAETLPALRPAVRKALS